MTSELSFGDWVRRRRKTLDLTQEQLADLVGCSHSAIRKIEKNERRPSIQIAQLLATHLEIPDNQQALFLQVARGIIRGEKLPSSETERVPTQKNLAPPANLPAPATPFIGRGQDIATLSKLIQDPHCRLVTLLGQGGVGKTRLAIHVAERSLPAFDGRVYFVPLAPLDNPDSILPAIASLFGLVTPNVDLKSRLAGYLREKHILLVLDNFEHLLEGASLLSELLIQAPRLKFLVTSRERLNLEGEWTLELAGLTVPPEPSQAESGVYDALELFEQSVKRVRPGITFTETDRAAAVQICNLVEGLPLAIELAAAWSQVLSSSEIAREIEKSFDFLRSSRRNIPERHRSLRAVFEQSWQLLSEEERAVVASLSIFRGGFSRDASESVADASLETLSSLLAKSLIRRAENGRFDMHEAVRQYAASRLEHDRGVREAHAIYYLSLLRDMEAVLKSPEQLSAIETLSHEFSNIQTAWAWGVENKMYGRLHDAVRLLWVGCDLRGRIREGFLETDALIQALRHEPATPETTIRLGRALSYHAMFCYRSGQYLQGQSAIEESITILRPLGTPELLIEPLLYSSIIYGLTGNLPAAQENLNEGVELARRFNDSWFLATGLFNQGFQRRLMGDSQQAYQLIKSSLVLFHELGNTRMAGLALNHLSTIAIELDVREEARAYLTESLSLADTYKYRWGTGSALKGFGVLALREGDTVSAESYLRQSIAVFTELGTRGDLAESMTLLGKVFLYNSEFDQARAALKDAIRLGLESNSMPQVYEAAVELADALLNLKCAQDAYSILAALPESAFKLEAVRRRAAQVQAELEAQSPSAGMKVEEPSMQLDEVLFHLLKE